MSIDFLPETVRYSALVSALAEKLRSPQPVDFDYWGEFKRLRGLVSAQTGEMKVLFPQFTPHDEAHHLGRLFGIADKMIGSERYARMTAAELFLLACGIYAHDWGMAVGSEELAFLHSGGRGEVNTQVFTPLDDERYRLRQFAEEQGVRLTGDPSAPVFTDDQIRLYIRQTHAWRSGVRARAFFAAAGSSVPQSLEQVCQGHWLDFSELDDERRFSQRAGVLGHSVNLLAVALYVRLVDLFDISDDRTPYAIWRFVAPSDRASQMEWRKHRALSPVTFPEYGDGRAVRFDGSTSDPEVWAELEDLRRYCSEQIAGAMDLLVRRRDERLQLDLRKLDWAVTPERFKPVNIRFEFHRKRMFEILADEIYQGDSHVFLRELLQNSIDAIRMRRALVYQRAAAGGRRRDMGLGFDDAIYFSVQHGADGDAVVTCRDYGIGMDEYIVRNYLAVAGVSYYRSDEFRHMRLEMDPVSRFGIGILSCFMVANRIQVETCREPQIAENREPLRIDIPAVDREFRIYAGEGSPEVGTTITVYVRGIKLKGDTTIDGGPRQMHSKRLRTAEYLASVAGFVEFPVVVDEDGRRTVILHPKQHRSVADQFARDGEEVDVRQVASGYPFEKLFVPQDIREAQRLLKPRVFNLHEDLGLDEYEGDLVFCVRANSTSRYEAGHLYAQGAGLMVHADSEDCNSVLLRLREASLPFRQYTVDSAISPSSQKDLTLEVYRDGILVPVAPVPKRQFDYRVAAGIWPVPVLRVNLPKRAVGTPDVARKTLKNADMVWDAPIWTAVVEKLRSVEVSKALQNDPPQRIALLATLVTEYWLTENEVAELVPRSYWPCPVLTAGGAISISDKVFLAGNTFYNIPSALEEIVSYLTCDPAERISEWWKVVAGHWQGEPSVVLSDVGLVHAVPSAVWMSVTHSYFDQRRLNPISVRFLSAPIPGFAPIPQVQVRCDESDCSQRDIVRELGRIIENPNSIDLFHRQLLDDHSEAFNHYSIVSRASAFEAPFADAFAWGDDYLNLNHPTTGALIRCIAATILHRLEGTLSDSVLGQLVDSVSAVIESLSQPHIVRARLSKLWALVDENAVISAFIPPALPEENEYIWGSLCPVRKNSLFEQPKAWVAAEKHLRKFGEVVLDSTPEILHPDLERELWDHLAE